MKDDVSATSVADRGRTTGDMVKKTLSCVIAILLTFLAMNAGADRGSIIWHEGVRLSQDSQKAIILHNASEEVLILGTELKANREVEILEFIPFPTEPTVSLAKGDPFENAVKLIKEKGLVFQVDNFYFGKGGTRGSATMPVEVRLSEKIGLHDVTVIKINDIGQFSHWLEDFFRVKGIRPDKKRLDGVYKNADDYLRRGHSYFVFDSVRVSEKVRFLEPLVYRFKTQAIYYPLKTSNLIGGTGSVELILILPGSITDDLWDLARNAFVLGAGREIRLSSSAKLYPVDIGSVYEPPFFGRGARPYLQVLNYRGSYDFKDDFTYPVNRLAPYAHRYAKDTPMIDQLGLIPPLTRDELRDFQDRFCLQDPSKDQFYVDRSVLHCENFIPSDEYALYSGLFRTGRLPGIPSRDVVLEASTTREQYRGKNIDKSIEPTIIERFNTINKMSYSLDGSLFGGDEKPTISVKEDKRTSYLFREKGKTYVSRAGFNKERNGALVYVEHITGPRSGVGYFVKMEKKNGEWIVAGSHLGTMY